MLRANPLDEGLQVPCDRLRVVHAGKYWVALASNLDNARRPTFQQSTEIPASRPVHGIDHHSEAGLTQSPQIHQTPDLLGVRGDGIDDLDGACGSGRREGHRANAVARALNASNSVLKRRHDLR